MRYIILTVTLLFFHSTFAQPIQLTGRVTAKSGSPIPFAHLIIENTGLGNITSTSGEFILKIPSSYCNKFLIVSCIGYETMKVPVQCDTETLAIQLNENVIELNAVQITGLTATGIVKEAISNLENNFQIDSMSYTVFGRITEKERNEPVLLEEFVFDMTHTKNQKADFYIRKIRGKGYNKLGEERLDVARLSDIHRIESNLMLRFTPGFLKERKMKKYHYQLEGEQELNGLKYYVISIDSEEYLQGGVLWVHKEDFGIGYMEKRYKTEEWENNVRSESIHRAYYIRDGKKWVFSHGSRTHNQELKKEGVVLSVQAFAVVTDRNKNSPFTQKEEMGLMVQKLKEFKGNYDDSYWEQYNYVPLDDLFK